RLLHLLHVALDVLAVAHLGRIRVLRLGVLDLLVERIGAVGGGGAAGLFGGAGGFLVGGLVCGLVVGSAGKQRRGGEGGGDGDGGERAVHVGPPVGLDERISVPRGIEQSHYKFQRLL